MAEALGAGVMKGEGDPTRGEDCMPPFNARKKLRLLGVLREFKTEAPPPTPMQGQPSGVNNTPAGAADLHTLAREEAPNQVEVVASTITPTGLATHQLPEANK